MARVYESPNAQKAKPTRRNVVEEKKQLKFPSSIPSSVPSSVPEPQPSFAPLEEALARLNEAVHYAHTSVSNLTSTLQPHLPHHMFGDSDGIKEAAPEGYPETGDLISPTLGAVNRALNEVNRLIERVDHLGMQVVR